MTFSSGMEALGGARSARLMSFAQESSAFLLQSMEQEEICFLLGDVRRIAPEYPLSLSEEEWTELALGKDASGERALPEQVIALCRMSIPYERPQDAGFDLSRLVFVNRESGRAMEAYRSGFPVIPLKKN
ncbi:MAG: flagellar assembly protein FliW [Mailhella sp.]|nr:flagellar assembly protein FliW [Mailhella sp.]